jgi:pimeloyl-ACP methyl ester carboxylesterase
VSATQPVQPDAESTLGDLLRHPAFTGFERLLLPWDDRAYDEPPTFVVVGEDDRIAPPVTMQERAEALRKARQGELLRPHRVLWQ